MIGRPDLLVMRLDPKRGAFALAEVLASLDRLEEARRELDRISAQWDAALGRLRAFVEEES